MRSGTGVATGRSELLVVLVIALAGIAVAAVVALAPWHPTRTGQAGVTGAVVGLDPPPARTRHGGPHRDRVPANAAREGSAALDTR